jgi:hypothetical protein
LGTRLKLGHGWGVPTDYLFDETMGRLPFGDFG